MILWLTALTRNLWGGLSAGPGLEVPGFRGSGDDALGAALTSPPRSKLSVWDGGTRIAGPHTS